MNSEELEQSLRSEFENYLKDIATEMRQSMSDFKQQFDADFDKHKEQLEESIRELEAKLGSERQLEASFTDTVMEHFKLARDEGARITAAAFAEAEEMEEKPEPPNFSALGDAIADISSKDSQSEILKALVNHATEFTPRGAFFIVKNEHLVGWRVFGREDHEDPKAVREVFFPVDSHTALSEAVRNLETVGETVADSEDDVMYRNKLGFENPAQMFAVPLIARGRGVAVLYADTGNSGEEVNIAALQSLVRVAGLTVEVLAAAPHAAPARDTQGVSDAQSEVQETEDHFADTADFGTGDHFPAAEFDSGAKEEISETAPVEFVETEAVEAPVNDYDVTDVGVEESVESFDGGSDQFQPIESEESEFGAVDPSGSDAASFEDTESFDDSIEEYDAAIEAEQVAVEGVETTEIEVEEDEFEGASSWDDAHSVDSDSFESDESYLADSGPSVAPASEFEVFESTTVEEFEIEESQNTYDFESEPDISADTDFAHEAPAAEVEELERPVAERVEEPSSDEYAFETDDGSAVEVREEPVAEAVEEAPVPVQEGAAPPVRSRFADRNLDLPIEVADNERRLHNDARRFARLLVSEIKLYNEQKVKEGRESSDLYERLREAIDRSREMYDKRVQPPVAAKFDYFNYELVNTLAEGDEGKLGGSYPGPAI